MAFWKESMNNRLSNLLNRNRSAAKISQVLCPKMYSLGDPCINSRGIGTGTSITPRYNTSLIINRNAFRCIINVFIIMFNIINYVVEIDRKLAYISEDLDKLCPPFIPGNERPTAVSLARILALANSAQHVIPEHNSLGPTKNFGNAYDWVYGNLE